MSALRLSAAKQVVAGLVSLLLSTGMAITLAPAANADSAPLNPADPGTPMTVTADALPTVQINGVAWSQVVVGNTVYVGGQVLHRAAGRRGAGDPGGHPQQPAGLRHPHGRADHQLRAEPQRAGDGRHGLGRRLAHLRRRRLLRRRRTAPRPRRGVQHRHRRARAGLPAAACSARSAPSRPRPPRSTSAATSPPSDRWHAPVWRPSRPPTARCCRGPRSRAWVHQWQPSPDNPR